MPNVISKELIKVNLSFISTIHGDAMVSTGIVSLGKRAARRNRFKIRTLNLNGDNPKNKNNVVKVNFGKKSALAAA